MTVTDILKKGKFECVNVFQDSKRIEIMSKGEAILKIGGMEIIDFWIENDCLNCLNICIYLK